MVLVSLIHCSAAVCVPNGRLPCDDGERAVELS